MISGGIKFFKRSKSLASDGSLVTASSGIGSSILDRSLITRWRSVGSDDTTVETLTIDFPASTTIDRLLLTDLNWKQFTIQYDLVGVLTDFTTVVGIDGALGGGITETTFADDTAYYEFDSVSTTQVVITVTKTQTADEEKFLNRFIATEELGTLQGYPRIRSVELNRNTKSNKMLSGKRLAEDSDPFFRTVLDFKNYPNSKNTDIQLMFDLFERDETFLVWLSGGRRGAEYYGFQLQGYRLQDVYNVKYSRSIKPIYAKGVYSGPVNFRVDLNEDVG